MITENTAKLSAGTYMSLSFDECLHPKAKDNRTADEIVDDTLNRLGIMVNKNG